MTSRVRDIERETAVWLTEANRDDLDLLEAIGGMTLDEPRHPAAEMRRKTARMIRRVRPLMRRQMRDAKLVTEAWDHSPRDGPKNPLVWAVYMG